MNDAAYRRAVTADERRLAERSARGRIIIIDDDLEILAALRALFELEGYVCETYASALAYLQGLSEGPGRFPGPCCLLCDVKLPRLDGLELQRQLGEFDDTPMLLMSGVSGAPEAACAFRAGALDFLIKPLDDETLLGAVATALAVSAERQRACARRRELRACLATLTEREREVARRVALGQRNLEIADALGIALRTVKRHRHQAMEKLKAETLVDLVHIFDESTGTGSEPDQR
ncbi:MAG: response regulator [Thiohalocapsa sp.]|jgi:RNA polymerase sigma factor (sigma-70 family)|uniref:response regulator transcription factor n=1 Tax=Thiohalocapsa sp. TaxID=2497641 RepID=UPI0025EC791E|nr:response regulator [Thiohalocapsa sp.]MCG6940886.1 response regulator [Thiohalocapsa sp.]